MARCLSDKDVFHLLAPPPPHAATAGAACRADVGMMEGHAAACRALKASRLLSLMGQHGMEFSLGIFLLRLYPSSLLLVSFSGLLDSLLLVVCGSAAGSYIDARCRLQAARAMYLLQNSMGALSAALMLALLCMPSRSGPGPLEWGGLVLSLAAGSANKLGAFGLTCVEREWSKVLSSGDSNALAALNSALKCIDLACIIASPILVGMVMQHSAASAALLLMAWCLLCWLPEVQLLVYAKRQAPALRAMLAREEQLQGQQRGSLGAGTSTDSNEPLAGTDELEPPSSSVRNGCACGWPSLGVLLRRQAQAWALYARQPAATAALALALLYLTVCSWGTLMAAYLLSMGLQESQLAVFRGLGAVLGILSSLSFRPLCCWLGLAATGAAGIWLQLACLLAGVLPAVAAALGAAVLPRLRLAMLVGGLTLSRYGLWTFDLSVNQIIQETAEPASLGSVNGVQGALQSLFQTLAYLAGALVPSLHEFVWLMAGSCCVVATAAVLYTAYAVHASSRRQQRWQVCSLPETAPV